MGSFNAPLTLGGRDLVNLFGHGPRGAICTEDPLLDGTWPARRPSRPWYKAAPHGCSPVGQVAEWLKAPHSKCGIRATVSGVRIPPCPPIMM